jgi:fibronectin-binding autotransporter adhesin
VISTRAPVASASIGTVNSITDSSGLSLESAGTNTVTTNLDDTGHLRVDANGGAGGTILKIGGTLTNGGSLSIGNATLSASDTVTAASLDNTGSIVLHGSSANQALLDVTGSAGFGAAEVLSGHVRLVGDSAIEFKSGEITSLAANAQLRLNGNNAFIEDSTAPGSNSALTGLASIDAGAIFGIHNKAAVSTTGALANDGHIRLDFVDGDGGSSLTLARALTNSGSLRVGNGSLSASDKVTAAALDNTGFIGLTGSAANQALLDVTDAAGFGTAGVVSGNVQLSGDSAIEFTSGQITSVAASAQLHLDGKDAFIEDSTKLGSNSALTALASISAGAAFTLENKAAVSTTGSLVNNGQVNLDTNGGDGGSSLTVGGALTNSGDLSIGNSALSASDKVTAASLDNTGGISLTGSGANQALLDVTGSAGFGAAGVLSGNVRLADDSAIEFASGQITSVTGQLTLVGNDAFIEDSTALGSNSALTGLADIAGSLNLADGASVSTTGALVNDGSVYFSGGSLTTGKLTNSNYFSIGNTTLATSSKVSTGALTNTGQIFVFGGCALNVSGATTNDSNLDLANGGSVSMAGAVDGAGSFTLGLTDLQFDSSVSAGQTIAEFGGSALILEQAQSFAATISGFGTGDNTIDAKNFLLSGTTFNFAENSGGTGGTLTLHDGSLTANILMTGDYSNSSFALAPDSGTGTLVKFV